MSSNLLIFKCRGDLTRTDDPHALRDALARLNIIIGKESGCTTFLNKRFKFNSFGS
jgi:hypothetical protein